MTLNRSEGLREDTVVESLFPVLGFQRRRVSLLLCLSWSLSLAIKSSHDRAPVPFHFYWIWGVFSLELFLFLHPSSPCILLRTMTSSQETAAPAFSHRASCVFTLMATVPSLGKGGTSLKISGSFSLNHLTSLYTILMPMPLKS